MRRPLALLVLLGGLLPLAGPAAAQVLPSFGGERAGTIGFAFLKVPMDPRTAALSEAVVAIRQPDAMALFSNPALAAQIDGALDVAFAQTSYYVDTDFYAAAAVARTGPFRLGLSVQAFDSGAMPYSDEFTGPDGNGQEFRLYDLAAGVTLSQALTDLFSYGLTAKYVREQVLDYTAQTALVDLGVFYRVGETGARIGVAIRNFGLDAEPSGEVTRETLGGPVTAEDFERVLPPTTFLLGVTYDAFQRGAHAVMLSGQLTNPADNAERFALGAEYVWNGLLVLRTGYQFGVEEANVPSLGVGVQVPGLGFAQRLRADYAYTQLDRLGDVHRVGLQFTL